MSSSTPPKIRSSEILRSRYQDLLKGTIPGQIASGLCENNLLTTEDLRTILSFEADAKRHQELLDILSCKGIPMLTKYSSAIKSIKSQPNLSNSESKVGEAPSPSGSSSQGPLALAVVPHRMDKECQGFPAMSNMTMGNPGVMNSAQGIALQKVQTGGGGTQAARQGSPAGDSGPQYGYDLVAVGSSNMDFTR